MSVILFKETYPKHSKCVFSGEICRDHDGHHDHDASQKLTLTLTQILRNKSNPLAYIFNMDILSQPGKHHSDCPSFFTYRCAFERHAINGGVRRRPQPSTLYAYTRADILLERHLQHTLKPLWTSFPTQQESSCGRVPTRPLSHALLYSVTHV